MFLGGEKRWRKRIKSRRWARLTGVRKKARPGESGWGDLPWAGAGICEGRSGGGEGVTGRGEGEAGARWGGPCEPR